MARIAQHGRTVKGGRMNVKEVTTRDLVEELREREGVEVRLVGPSETLAVETDGPAIVLIVTD